MNDHNIALLRRKLEALNYKDALEPVSAPLVQKLVDDLVHTTESYRGVKLQSAKKAQEVDDLQNKLEVLRRDSGRLASENNHLHLQLIKEAERFDRAERQHYQRVKQLEGQISELAFWKHQTLERFLALEKENEGLKGRIEDLLRAGERMKPVDLSLRDDASRIAMTRPIGEHPVPAASVKISSAKVDLLKAADSRVHSLEASMRQKEADIERLEGLLAEAQDSIKRREVEISRLGGQVEKGRDVDKLNLEYRNEANESVILQLNSQVDFLTGQLSDMQRQLADKARKEAALKQAEQARDEAEMRLKTALEESAAVAKEVEAMKASLQQLQAKGVRIGSKAAVEVETAIAKVLEVKGELAHSKSGQEALRKLMLQAQKERVAALQEGTRREAELQEKAKQLQALLDDARKQRDSLQQRADSTAAELKAAYDKLAEAGGQVAGWQKQAQAAEAELQTRSVALEQMQAEREAANSKVEELAAQLAASATASGQDYAARVDLEARKARWQADSARLESQLAAAQAERESLQAQLKEAVQAKLRATNASKSAEEDRARLSVQLSALGRQLAEEREQVAELASERNALQTEANRLRSQVSVLEGQVEVLQEEANAATRRLREGREALVAQQKELAQAQHLHPRLDQLQQQVRECTSKLTEAEKDASRAKAEAVRATEGLQRAQQDVDALRRGLDEAEVDRNSLRLQLQETQHQLADTASALKAAEGTARIEGEARQAADAEVARMREVLNASSTLAKDSSFVLKTSEQKIAALQRQLLGKEEELDRLQGQLAAAQAASEAARGRETETRNQARDYAERARRAEMRAEELETDLANIRADQDAERARSRATADKLQAVRQELTERSHEVEQLTTLSLKGDATIQEYMSQLKRLSTELRAAELRAGDLQAEVQKREDELSQQRAEIAGLHKAVAAVDGDRDGIQGELDSRAEQVAQLTEELELGHRQVDERNRALATAEGRLARADERIRDNEAEIRELSQQLEVTTHSLQALQAEYGAARDELHAVSEDLEVVVKENQVVTNQLSTATTERDTWHHDLRAATARVAATEQLVRAKETEVEDLRKAYESLAGENRRLQSSIASLEREVAAREGQAAGQAGEVAMLQEAQRTAQAQLNQYVMDLQAFERQVDVLSRQASRAAGENEDLDRERQALLDRLRAAEQVRFELERARETMQRQMAALDGQLHVAQARLEDSAAENKALTHKLSLEANRVAELESLLGSMRSSQFRSQVDMEHSGGRASALEERNALLEEQVSSLQSQVQALQHTSSIQEVELARLRQEAAHLSATAATAAHQGMAGSGPAAAAPAELHRHTAALEARLRDAEGMAAGLRVQAEQLSGQKASLETSLAAAHAEIDNLSTALASIAAGGATPSEELANREGVVRARLADLDTRNATLHSQLAEAKQQLQQAEAQLGATQVEMAQLQEDNDRLIDMLSKLDLEQSHVQQENASLHSALQQGTAGTASPSHTSGQRASQPAALAQGDGAASNAAHTAASSPAEVAQLRAELAAEQARRQQAERDFHELMESVEGMDFGSASPGGSSGSPGAGTLAANPKAAQLQATLAQLERENMALKENLAQAKGVVGGVTQELTRARTATSQSSGSAAGAQQPTAAGPAVSEGMGSSGSPFPAASQ